ncbi:MAG TPA: hypothetical protein VKQ29_10280 [Aliidongia sp.]|nr:hypothetical protein [Aliidongia sp.]
MFEERLVLVRTVPADRPIADEDHVRIHWGEEFTERYQAAFPDQPNPVVSLNYGPLALEYILAAGGAGYFRQGFVQPCLDQGRLVILEDSPEFSYSAYVVYSTRADQDVMTRVRSGLRAAAAAAAMMP